MGEFEAGEVAEFLKRQKQNFDDYQDELPGRENGKRVRFVRRDEERSEAGRDKKRAQVTSVS